MTINLSGADCWLQTSDGTVFIGRCHSFEVEIIPPDLIDWQAVIGAFTGDVDWPEFIS